MKLTDAKIRGAKPREKSYKLSDGERLQLLVHRNGSKYWQFAYKFSGKERVLSLGKYPGVSLANAREEKLEAQKLLRKHIDPSSHRKQEKLTAAFRDRNSFLAVAEEWRLRNADSWTDKYNLKTWGRLTNHVFPTLARRPVAEILPLEVLAVVQAIERKGMTEMSHRVLRLCGSIFRFAVITGRCTHNPTIGLNDALKPHRTTHFATLRREEVAGFLRKLESVSANEQNRIALKLLMHTAVRTGELRSARWIDFDLRRMEWRVPAEKMKMRREHVVPLSRQSLELLDRLREISGDQEWLFPNQQGRVHPTMSENTINALIHRMGYQGRIVGHGFRSLFSTILNEEGFNRDAIERQLAHQERNAVRAAYNRAEYLTERKELMAWWSNFLSQEEHTESENRKFMQPPLREKPHLVLVSSAIS